jgi:hypothetical protein
LPFLRVWEVPVRDLVIALVVMAVLAIRVALGLGLLLG